MPTAHFGTAITCIDGRVYEPVVKWLKEQHRLEYVDLITVPGPDQALVQGLVEVITQVRQAGEISVRQHGSTVIAVVGHHNCSANPVSREVHEQQIRQAVEVVRRWRLRAEVIGLWVNERWEVEEVAK